MSFYLRVEGVNLGNFVKDTNDLSTTRGGGLLLLEAMEIIEQLINKSSVLSVQKIKSDLEEQLKQIEAIQNPTQSDKNKRDKIKKKLKKIKTSANKSPYIPAITKGASWGLFELEVSEEEACKIQSDVIDYFNKDIRYRHATFVVNIHKNNGDSNYQTDRDSLQTLNRWQQMQSPSLAISKEGKTSCAIDKVRPANTSRYLKNKEYDFVSNSINRRRKYGIVKKRIFYKEIIQKTADNNYPAIDELIKAKYTQDLEELSQSNKRGILSEKIAFIYIDGNRFGEIQRNSKLAIEQEQFDKNTREGRERLLRDILLQIYDKPDWLTDKGKVRLETLLWGGDEIIWVVPAWQGWWMVGEFYNLAKQHIKHHDKPLFHACGLVFCHHNAPIHRVDSLARNLADQYAKTDKKKNLVAYQVLESFDHAGMQVESYRKNRIGKLGKMEHLTIDAENMANIQESIVQLKNDKEFAKRKIYQILHAYRLGDTGKAVQFLNKLPESTRQTLSLLQTQFGGEQAHWLHLMDLWDYIN